MTEAVRTFKFKNAEYVPESLSERFGFDENDHLVNINEKGEATQARKLGYAIVELGLKGGMIEEEAPPQASPEVALLLRRLDEIESQMDEMMAFIEGKTSDPDEISPAMQAKIDAIIEEKTKPLKDKIDELITENQSLKEDNERLEKELAEAKGEAPKPKDPEFKTGDEVVVDQTDSKFRSGYVFERIEDKDDKKYAVLKDKSGSVTSVEMERVKRPSDVNPTDIVAYDTPPPTTPQAQRKRFEVRQSWYDKVRGRPARQYFIDDDNRPYYLDESDQPVYVRKEELEEREGSTAAGIAIGAFAVGATALITWLLTRHGHNGVNMDEFNSLKINENRHHLQEMQAINTHHVQEMNAIDAAKNAELKAISAHDAHMTREIWHSHKHDQQIYDGIQNRIDREHAQEMRAIKSLHDRLQNTGIYWGARYPWDWAASKVGSLQAESWLHTLAGRAAKHGHKVVWLHNQGKEVLQVDGTTNTAKVVNTLNRYR